MLRRGRDAETCFLHLKYFMKCFIFYRARKQNVCATINTVNGSVMGKATMIVLCVICASLESEKNILHFKLCTEHLNKEPSDF